MPDSDKWPWSAYTLGEAAPQSVSPQTPPAVASDSSRRRRMPNPEEQARRQGWGRRWGGMIGEFWRQQHESEA